MGFAGIVPPTRLANGRPEWEYIVAVYGTVVVAGLHATCGSGDEPIFVQRIASAMVWSTWIFSIILWYATTVTPAACMPQP